MKKLLLIILFLLAGNYNVLTAARTSCQRIVDMLSEQPELQSPFAATTEYQQCAVHTDALNTVTKSAKPEYALVVTQQLVQDGHKVTSEHVDQCIHAYWSARYQAGKITPSWISTADKEDLLRARSWMHYAQHFLALAQFLTDANTNIHNRAMEPFTKINFARIADERAQEVRLIEQALQRSDE